MPDCVTSSLLSLLDPESELSESSHLLPLPAGFLLALFPVGAFRLRLLGFAAVGAALSCWLPCGCSGAAGGAISSRELSPSAKTLATRPFFDGVCSARLPVAARLSLES